MLVENVTVAQRKTLETRRGLRPLERLETGGLLCVISTRYQDVFVLCADGRLLSLMRHLALIDRLSSRSRGQFGVDTQE